MASEYRYKAQIRTTQAIKHVQPPDTKTQKPSGKDRNVFPNQMQAH